ncbi:hypothetical protein AB1K54_15330 [Microbacterium sp. BWT-B31]|uniref:hypothetical protein n=1 Tax=Microbacterium sp. BWT-B31 TaxID=3232072 RepID=UPI003529A04E
MSGTVRRRRHSPAVYRRRRLVVVLGILVVVAAVWLLITQPWSGWAGQADAGGPQNPDSQTVAGPAPTIPVPDSNAVPEQSPAADPADSDGDPAATDPAAGSPSATPTVGSCHNDDITVQAVTDAETYDPGQNPQLSITLTNKSSADCAINVGTATQSFTISSGDDTWWRSTDCQTTSSDMIVTLKAGQTVSSAAPLAWDRTRSSVAMCDSTERQQAGDGGATYRLTVEIGGFTSMQPKQFFLS